MARRVARDAPIFKNPTTYQSSIYGYFSCNVDILRKSCLSVFLQGCKSVVRQLKNPSHRATLNYCKLNLPLLWYIEVNIQISGKAITL